jgi:hypothetical protein
VSGAPDSAVLADEGGEERVAAWAAAPLAPAELLDLAGEGVRSEHTRSAYADGFRALAEFPGVADERAAVAALLAADNRGAQALVVRFRQDLLVGWRPVEIQGVCERAERPAGRRGQPDTHRHPLGGSWEELSVAATPSS